MFTLFIATFSMPRDKIAIIKTIRMIAGPNHNLGKSLKACKDAVEAKIPFGSYMDDHVTIKLRLDEMGVGRLAYYQMQHTADASIINIVGIEPIAENDFDLT